MNFLVKIPVKENDYICGCGDFKQSEQLAELLKKLSIQRSTFHGLRDTHASFFDHQDIDDGSKRLGHINIKTTQNFYLDLMQKKHQQDADAFHIWFVCNKPL